MENHFTIYFHKWDNDADDDDYDDDISKMVMKTI